MTRYRRPASLAYVVDDQADPRVPVTYLFPIPEGPVSALSGSAALIWALASEGEEDVTSAVGQTFGVDPETVRDDVHGCLKALVAQGFLELRHDLPAAR